MDRGNESEKIIAKDGQVNEPADTTDQESSRMKTSAKSNVHCTKKCAPFHDGSSVECSVKGLRSPPGGVSAAALGSQIEIAKITDCNIRKRSVAEG